MEKVWSVILLIFICCWRGNKQFDVHLRRICPVYFLWNDGDDAASAEENEGKVFFPQIRHILFVGEVQITIMIIS